MNESQFTGMTNKTNVGPGWQPLIEEAIAYLDEHVPNWKPLQIKEKFGTLRFYWDGAADNLRARDYILEIEARSSQICENCGKPAITRNVNGWWKTLCDKCRAELRAEEA